MSSRNASLDNLVEGCHYVVVFNLVLDKILECKLGLTLGKSQLWVDGVKCRKCDYYSLSIAAPHAGAAIGEYHRYSVAGRGSGGQDFGVHSSTPNSITWKLQSCFNSPLDRCGLVVLVFPTKVEQFGAASTCKEARQQ